MASEVREYKLSHLRRLDVTPGMTGLWQVQGRQDPSFDSYISLDVTYIENWSIWLDMKIIVRTIGVVLCGDRILEELTDAFDCRAAPKGRLFCVGIKLEM